MEGAVASIQPRISAPATWPARARPRCPAVDEPIGLDAFASSPPCSEEHAGTRGRSSRSRQGLELQRLAELADHLAERGVLASHRIDVGHPQGVRSGQDQRVGQSAGWAWEDSEAINIAALPSASRAPAQTSCCLRSPPTRSAPSESAFFSVGRWARGWVHGRCRKTFGNSLLARFYLRARRGHCGRRRRAAVSSSPT